MQTIPREPWICPRCLRMCAPHLDHCDCSPEPVYVPYEQSPPVAPTPPLIPEITPGPVYPGTPKAPWVLTWPGAVTLT